MQKRLIFRIWEPLQIFGNPPNLFSKKSQSCEKVFLQDDSKNLTENEIDIAGIFNDYFVNVTKSLNIETSETCQIKCLLTHTQTKN